MWNFVIDGCVDGYSCLQTHMKVSTDNLAETSLRFFVDSIKEFGIPARVRVDGGNEFVHIETFMNSVFGNKMEIRCLRGKSVHNVRIERLWETPGRRFWINTDTSSCIWKNTIFWIPLSICVIGYF